MVWSKRCLDLILCLITLPAVAVVSVLVALAIRLDTGGSILFCQDRVGRGGRLFKIYKFRTLQEDFDEEAGKPFMVALVRGEIGQEGSEGPTPMYKPDHRDQQTLVGRFLRRTSLDELPQIFNIVKGDMSWVGPRPHVPFEVAEYQPWHRKRLAVLPGMTGLAQVLGRSGISFDTLVRHDLQYIDQWSLGMDLKILWWTLLAAVGGKGAG